VKLDQPIKNILYSIFLIGVVLLSVHLKTGAGSDGGLNIIAVLSRAQVWFLSLIVLFLFLKPKIFFIKFSIINIKRTIIIYSWPAFLFLCLISTFISIISNDVGISKIDSSNIFQVVICFGLVLIVLNLLDKKPEHIKGILIAMLLMPLIQIFGILLISNDLAQYIGVNDEYDFVWYFGYGERFVGLLGNANGVSVGCSVAFAIWLILFLNLKTISKKYYMFLTSMLLVYGALILIMIIMTGVRASLLSILIMSFLCFFLISKKQKIVVFTMSMFLLFVLIVFSIQTGLFYVLQERLQQSNGRFFIWKYYLEQLAVNPLGFGLTFENVIDVTKLQTLELFTVRLTPHNAFLEVGVYTGILGIILTFVCLLAVIKSMVPIFKNSSIKLGIWYKAACVAWLGLMVNYFFGSLIYGSWYFAILSSIIVSYEHNQKTNTF